MARQLTSLLVAAAREDECKVPPWLVVRRLGDEAGEYDVVAEQ